MTSKSKAQFSSMRLCSFIDSVRQNEDPSEAKDILRLVQRACFNMLWAECDTKLTRTFANIGQVTQHLFRDDVSRKWVFDNLAKQPFVGMLKANARMKYHNDIRFVVAVSGKQFFMILDNNASDQQLAQIHVYNGHPEVAGFVEYPSPVPHSALADFLMTKTLQI